jgi:LysR family nitrogen assimilation transcriptional regulator
MFQEYAQNILREMQRAREDLNRGDFGLNDTVALGLPSSISMMFGVPLLLQCRAELPHISLRLSDAMSGHIKRWLDEGAIDLGILHDVDALHHMSVRRIALERMFLIGPVGSFGQCDSDGISETSVDLADFRFSPLILPSSQHGLRQFVDRAEGHELAVEIELDSLFHIKSMVAAGRGYTILSHAAVAEELRQKKLSACHVSAPSLQRMIYLVRNPQHKISRGSVQVGDILISIMHQMIKEKSWLAEIF